MSEVDRQTKMTEFTLGVDQILTIAKTGRLPDNDSDVQSLLYDLHKAFGLATVKLLVPVLGVAAGPAFDWLEDQVEGYVPPADVERNRTTLDGWEWGSLTHPAKY